MSHCAPLSFYSPFRLQLTRAALALGCTRLLGFGPAFKPTTEREREFAARASKWEILEVACCMLFLLLMGLRVFNYIQSRALLPTVYAPSVFVPLISLSQVAYVEKAIAGLCAFLTWMRLFKFLRFGTCCG